MNESGHKSRRQLIATFESLAPFHIRMAIVRAQRKFDDASSVERQVASLEELSSLMPLALERLRSELIDARSEIVAARAAAHLFLERRLVEGRQKLVGRPQRALPEITVEDPRACLGIKFNQPETGAVTLANGHVLFDATSSRLSVMS